MTSVNGYRPTKRRVLPALIAVLVLAMCAWAGCGSSSATGPPVIDSVTISGTAGAYTVTVVGRGFGVPAADVALPYLGDLSNFRLVDLAQSGHGEWGYSGDTNALAYTSWFDTQIQVTGFGAGPGDAVVLVVSNANSGQSAAWGGNVPPSPSGGPAISSVQFAGSGANLQITVLGSGFGSAPVPMPYTGDLDQFFFEDERNPCAGAALFNAGWTSWGSTTADAVTLKYQSWSDSQIQISGFAGQYGQGCATVLAGDPVAIGVFNGGATDAGGAQTAWGGLVSAPSQ